MTKGRKVRALNTRRHIKRMYYFVEYEGIKFTNKGIKKELQQLG